MEKILIVEDSRFFMNIIASNIQKSLDVELVCAENLAQAAEILEKDADSIFLSLLDLNLPDAPDGEIVDLVRAKYIPMIVFTGTYHDKLQSELADKGVIDYIVKDNPASLSYLIATISRLHANRQVETLVVDDSRTFRLHVCGLLKRYFFNVHEAENGEQALAVIRENPSIRLVVTDYNMPVMNGFDFIRDVRKDFPRDKLSIIGVTGGGVKNVSAKFLKVGANDFLTKPFSHEEFFCRVSQNMDNMDRLDALHHQATTDQLTGMPNRRRLFDEENLVFGSMKSSSTNPVVAMIDIDKFKQVNDVHGHDVGDEALKHTASILSGTVRKTDMLARFGGEEFCFLTSNMASEHVVRIFEKMRKTLEENPLPMESGDLRITVSIGVCTSKMDNLEDMLKAADEALYKAKEGGRNQVVIAS